MGFIVDIFSPPAPPAAPVYQAAAAPDYAAANEAAVFADVSTLPARRKIEQAMRLGQEVTYYDPKKGEDVTADFTGFGDVDLTEAEMGSLIERLPEMTQAQLDNLTTFGPQFVTQARAQLEQMAPEEFGLREDLATRLRSGEDSAEELLSAGLPDVPEYGEVEAPDIGDTGRTAAGRAELEERIFDRLSLGEKLSPEQQRSLEQAVLRSSGRKGQAISPSATLREVLAKFGGGEELGRQRRAEAASWLGSGQATSDVTNRFAQANFANAMQQIQQANQARGAGYAGQQQNLAAQLGARQQDVGNIQSMLGLQPIAAQGGYLSGLLQGAAPFTMPQMSRGVSLDPNAGAGGTAFAGNVFGTQADIFGTQADIWGTQANLAAQPSGFGQLVGGVLGAFGGGYGEALGARKGGG